MTETGERIMNISGSGDRISDHQRDVLKDKTGFEGYTAYLEDYNSKHAGCEQLLTSWRLYAKEWPQEKRRYSCEILDLIRDENSLISLYLCCRTVSYSKLFTALSEPRKGVYGRIVIYRGSGHYLYDPDFFEDLGLVLNIGPAFLKSLDTLLTRGYYDDQPSPHIPVFEASHVMVGDRVATMTRCCISEKSSAVPIVLIAEAPYASGDPRSVDPIFGTINSSRRSNTISSRSRYTEMIMSIIERNSVFSQSADALILPAPFAAIHLDACSLRTLCDYTLPGDGSDGLGSFDTASANRKELRRRIEDFENLMQDALTGFSSLYGADWPHKYQCESTVEFFKETIDRTRRFEAYVQDLCQLQSDQLSLEETRKAIEVSVSQIEEGKRVKIFTILAFVYVPLNLASSIFGMNIQQLNNSGQSIQTFLVTAAVVLVLTGISWLCTEQVNQYRSWLRRPRPRHFEQSSARPTYSIAVRLRILVWLYCNGHWAWARETEAWRYILANVGGDSLDGFGSRLPEDTDESDKDLSAGEYVSAYMSDSKWPFQTSSEGDETREETP